MAELCAVPDVDVVPIAAAVPDELAAAFGLSGVAAWMALSWRARLQSGERVLVLGGGGAVGQAGIGAARVLGASAVVGDGAAGVGRTRAGRPARTSSYRSTGRSTPLAAALAEHGPFDVVLDPVWGVAATAASRDLAEHGRLVNLGGAGERRAPYSSAVLRSRTASVLGYTNNALTSDQRGEAITAVLGHAAAGRIRMQYDVRPLAEVEQVWKRKVAGESEPALRPGALSPGGIAGASRRCQACRACVDVSARAFAEQQCGDCLRGLPHRVVTGGQVVDLPIGIGLEPGTESSERGPVLPTRAVDELPTGHPGEGAVSRIDCMTEARGWGRRRGSPPSGGRTA